MQIKHGLVPLWIMQVGADVSLNNCHSLLKPHYTGNTSGTCTYTRCIIKLTWSNSLFRHSVFSSAAPYRYRHDGDSTVADHGDHLDSCVRDTSRCCPERRWVNPAAVNGMMRGCTTLYYLHHLTTKNSEDFCLRSLVMMPFDGFWQIYYSVICFKCLPGLAFSFMVALKKPVIHLSKLSYLRGE